LPEYNIYIMIHHALVEFDLDMVTAQFDGPSGIPILPALDTAESGPVQLLDRVGRARR